MGVLYAQPLQASGHATSDLITLDCVFRLTCSIWAAGNRITQVASEWCFWMKLLFDLRFMPGKHLKACRLHIICLKCISFFPGKRINSCGRAAKHSPCRLLGATVRKRYINLIFCTSFKFAKVVFQFSFPKVWCFKRFMPLSTRRSGQIHQKRPKMILYSPHRNQRQLAPEKPATQLLREHSPQISSLHVWCFEFWRISVFPMDVYFDS